MLDVGLRDTADISYDDERHVLQAGPDVLRIPSGTLEQCFCRVLFKHKPGTAISWDVISEEMDLRDVSPEDIRTAKQRIKDVKRRLNVKIAQVFRVVDYFRSDNSEYYRK